MEKLTPPLAKPGSLLTAAVAVAETGCVVWDGTERVIDFLLDLLIHEPRPQLLTAVLRGRLEPKKPA